MIYVLYLCTLFDGQPNINTCSELQVGQYAKLEDCTNMISVLKKRNIEAGRLLDDGDIHLRFFCGRPGQREQVVKTIRK